MKRFRKVLLVSLALSVALAGCSSESGGDDASSPPPTAATSSPTALAPDATAPPATTVAPDEPTAISITDLLNRGAGEFTVGAAIVWDQASARLCDGLMESFPAQCGGPWVVIANPDGVDADFDEANGVKWTPNFATVTGRYDGERFIVMSADAGVDVEPTADDQSMVDAIVAFVNTPSVDTLAAVPLSDEVALGLGPDIEFTIARDQLADPAAWTIDREEFRAWAGPFSVPDTISEPLQITVGPHARCVAPPEPAPAGYDNLRRVSIQPTDATSCIEWWSIDLFLNTTGDIEAITLDLFAP